MIRKTKTRDIEFNTTALPDIVFMLLFFFMVATVMKDKEKSKVIELPYSTYNSVIKQQDEFIHISVTKKDKDLSYELESKRSQTIEELESDIVEFLKQHPDRHHTKLKIKIQPDVNMKDVNAVKQILQRNELYDIEYVTKRRL